MIYPGYLLNPGDMFQVDPARVLFATGAPKDRTERRVGRVIARGRPKKAEGKEGEDEATETSGEAKSTEAADGTAAQGSRSRQSTPTAEESLTRLLSRARSILQDPRDAIGGKRKKDLRAFQRTIQRALSRAGTASNVPAANLDTELTTLISKLSLSSSPSPSLSSTAVGSVPGMDDLSPDDQRALKAALREARENPVDATKPYATPWRPRPYMSAFAFIPRFLEVNQNVCSAVYLRHPVARPGLAEVPSPVHPDTHQLAFNWYLRRGR